MVAESNPVRRLRRLFGTTGALVRGRGAVIAAGALVAGVVTVGAAMPLAAAVQAPLSGGEPAPAEVGTTAPAQVDGSGIALHLAPTGASTLDPAAPATIGVEIVNASPEVLAQGTVRLSVADEGIDDVDELDAWLDDAAAAATGVGEAASPSVSSGSSGQVLVGLPAGLVGGAPVVGLRAELIIDGAAVAVSEAAFASTTAPAAGAAGLAIAYPLTVPDETTGLIDAEQLENWTRPEGLLSRQLDAVADRPVAIGVDPRIIASIRVLGSSAPESAVEWLTRLSQLGNVVFPLAYADADLAVQSQLALPGLLAPTSFWDVLDPADFTEGVAVAPTPSAGAVPTETPAATPAPTDPADAAEDVLPTTDELLAWPYTRTDIGWPADDTVAAGDLAWLSGVGLTTAILSPGNVAAEDGGADDAGAAGRANAASTIDGGTAVVADSRVSPALRAAVDATSDAAWREATGRLGAELAVLVDPDAPAVSVLATFQRTGGAGADRVGATLEALSAMPWVQGADLSDTIGAPPVARPLASTPETDDRRATVQRMLESEAATSEFATVLTDPRLLTAETRRDLLAVLDAAAVPEPVEWHLAAGEWLTGQSDLLAAVSVVPSSPINVISRESGVPATVENRLPYPVTVFVDVAPSNGRLIVEERQQVTVEPESRASVIVPVAAGVGSGDVTLTVTLLSPEGVQIGSPAYFDVNVQADWEGLGATILAVLAVLVFGIGIWRSIRKRRRARAAAADEAAADEAVAGETSVDEAADASRESESAAAGKADASGKAAGEASDAPPAEPTEPAQSSERDDD